LAYDRGRGLRGRRETPAPGPAVAPQSPAQREADVDRAAAAALSDAGPAIATIFVWRMG